MSKLVVIFSVEGIESNTEVNYFTNLSHHIKTSELNIACKAIGKLSSSDNNTHKTIANKTQLLWDRVEDALNEICPENYNQALFYFIGDFDKEQDIPSMINAMDIAIKAINEYMAIANIQWSIHDEIIGDNSCNIEDVLYPSDKPEFIKLKKHKKGSVKNFFEIWAEHHKIELSPRESLIESLKSFFEHSNIKLIFDVIE